MRKGEGKCTTYNGRFGVMAAVTPQKRQCEISSFVPRIKCSESPACRQAAGTLYVSRARVLLRKQ